MSSPISAGVWFPCTETTVPPTVTCAEHPCPSDNELQMTSCPLFRSKLICGYCIAGNFQGLNFWIKLDHSNRARHAHCTGWPHPRFSENHVCVLGETTRLSMVTEAKFSVESIVRVYHVYKDVWAASGET